MVRPAQQALSPISDALSLSFLCLPFQGLGENCPYRPAEKFPVNLRVGEELILKEAVSRDILAHFPQVAPVVLTVQNCGDSPPTHSFTLLLVHIFRQEFPSHPKANEMLSVAFCLAASLFILEGEGKLLIILYFSHTLGEATLTSEEAGMDLRRVAQHTAVGDPRPQSSGHRR